MNMVGKFTLNKVNNFTKIEAPVGATVLSFRHHTSLDGSIMPVVFMLIDTDVSEVETREFILVDSNEEFTTDKKLTFIGSHAHNNIHEHLFELT